MSAASPIGASGRRGQRTVAGACAAVALLLGAGRARAEWPPSAADDGVYGRFGGDTDISLKLGGMLRDEGVAGSVGGSMHYYSLLGVTADYSESLAADASDARSFSVGLELRPLFLPRWALGHERGPAWLDLSLDSLAAGFGAYFSDAEVDGRNTRGLWVSLGAGVPLLGSAAGPWVEVRALRRFPDQSAAIDAHNALFVYLSWHHILQLGPSE